MKKQIKNIIGGIALFALSIGGVYAFQYVTSEKVYLQNSISNALIQQEELAQANSILREFLSERKVTYEKAKKEYEDTKSNIIGNSTHWEFLSVEINEKQFRLSVITEADKNIGNRTSD